MYLNLASEAIYQTPVIADRIAFACADDLVIREGDDAVLTAAEKADASAANGDLTMVGYWRRVESAVQILLLQEVIGELH
jgi:hypothetical protein